MLGRLTRVCGSRAEGGVHGSRGVRARVHMCGGGRRDRAWCRAEEGAAATQWKQAQQIL